MMFFRKISMLIIAVSVLCGEEVFARHHSRDDSDREVSRSAKRLHKARSEQRKAEKNAERKRQKRIRAERRFKKKVEKKQRARTVKRRSSSVPLPRDEWKRVDYPDGMSEIIRIRYRKIIVKKRTTILPYPQKPIVVPTIIAGITLAALKEKTAQEPPLESIMIKKRRRKARFF